MALAEQRAVLTGMYKSDEEIFKEVVEELELLKHPRHMMLCSCASTLLGSPIGDLSEYTHEQVLLLAHGFGFEFESHEEARVVVDLYHRYQARRQQADEELRTVPFECFDAMFFRDRRGRLMARFQIGTHTFRPIELTESFERKFALVYQDTLRAAVELGEGALDGVHDAEDANRTDE